jgi:hypothetical protein
VVVIDHQTAMVDVAAAAVAAVVVATAAAAVAAAIAAGPDVMLGKSCFGPARKPQGSDGDGARLAAGEKRTGCKSKRCLQTGRGGVESGAGWRANQAESDQVRCRVLLHCELAQDPHLPPRNTVARDLIRTRGPVLPEAIAGVVAAVVSVAPGAAADAAAAAAVVVGDGDVGVSAGAGADAGAGAGAAAATRSRKMATETAGSGLNTTGCRPRHARDRSWRVGTGSAAAAVNGRTSSRGWTVKAVQTTGGCCEAAGSGAAE